MNDRGRFHLGFLIIILGAVVLCVFIVQNTLIPLFRDFLIPRIKDFFLFLSEIITYLLPVIGGIICGNRIWSLRNQILKTPHLILVVSLSLFLGYFFWMWRDVPFKYLLWSGGLSAAMMYLLMVVIARYTKRRFLKYLDWFESRYKPDMINWSLFRGGYSMDWGIGRIEFLEFSDDEIEKMRTMEC